MANCITPNILSHQVAATQTGDNKGGAMIYSDMQTCNTCSFSSPGIEVACSTVTLPNANHMQILVLYRSPSVQLQALIVRLLHYVSTTNMPTVILGDFNHDVLSQPNSSIISLMSNYGFTQLVKAPTTAKGTLIDHVYYNRPTSDIIVEVCDTYYSDHDTVYCSIPA